MDFHQATLTMPQTISLQTYPMAHFLSEDWKQPKAIKTQLFWVMEFQKITLAPQITQQQVNGVHLSLIIQQHTSQRRTNMVKPNLFNNLTFPVLRNYQLLALMVSRTLGLSLLEVIQEMDTLIH